MDHLSDYNQSICFSPKQHYNSKLLKAHIFQVGGLYCWIEPRGGGIYVKIYLYEIARSCRHIFVTSM